MSEESRKKARSGEATGGLLSVAGFAIIVGNVGNGPIGAVFLLGAATLGIGLCIFIAGRFQD